MKFPTVLAFTALATTQVTLAYSNIDPHGGSSAAKLNHVGDKVLSMRNGESHGSFSGDETHHSIGHSGKEDGDNHEGDHQGKGSDHSKDHFGKGKGHSGKGKVHSGKGKVHSGKGKGHSGKGKGHSGKGKGHFGKGKGHSGKEKGSHHLNGEGMHDSQDNHDGGDKAGQAPINESY